MPETHKYIYVYICTISIKGSIKFKQVLIVIRKKVPNLAIESSTFLKTKQMGSAKNIGKYQIRRTIGEGTFAKVKLAVDSTNGQYVALKVIDKLMVMQSNLKFQACFIVIHFQQMNGTNVCLVYLCKGILFLLHSGAKRNNNNENSTSPQHSTYTRGMKPT